MPTSFFRSELRNPENLFSSDDIEAQRAFFTERPHLTPTPVHRHRTLGAALGLGEVLVKDETARFGLNAFKPAGALFAIATLQARGVIRAGDTLVCASEGNHGRAVARAASHVSCRARVYMASSVAPARAEAIRSEGAEVVLVEASYDEAVRVMAREAENAGWIVISDTSWEGYSEIPRLIVLGYTRLMDETWGGASPTVPTPDVIFVPAGVGGLLAAVACWCDWRYGTAKPRIVAVEPIAAACVQESVRRGAPTAVQGPFDTRMGGLRCGEMSPDFFAPMNTLVDAFVGIEDRFAFDAMRRLASPAGHDVRVICAASGAAALGGLIAVVEDPGLAALREWLALGATTRALVIASEGATDPALLDEVLSRD
jgi:diaminopropionate ammonia-lyase